MECPNCGKDLTLISKRKRRFCSDYCSHTFRRLAIHDAKIDQMVVHYCNMCGEPCPLKTGRPRLYCSYECKRKAWNVRRGCKPILKPRLKDRSSNEMPNKTIAKRLTNNKLGTHVVGAIGEAFVCADLANKGYSVYLPFNPVEHNDLVVCKNDKFYRVEVKVARYTETGRLRYGIPNKKHIYDVLAIVADAYDITYIPNLE